MQLEFLTLPDTERRLYFEQIAIQRNLSPVILEKDFWVSWLELLSDVVAKRWRTLLVY
jgi:hypothetical protein